jgi:hypothetical protein
VLIKVKTTTSSTESINKARKKSPTLKSPNVAVNSLKKENKFNMSFRKSARWWPTGRRT